MAWIYIPDLIKPLSVLFVWKVCTHAEASVLTLCGLPRWTPGRAGGWEQRIPVKEKGKKWRQSRKNHRAASNRETILFLLARNGNIYVRYYGAFPPPTFQQQVVETT